MEKVLRNLQNYMGHPSSLFSDVTIKVGEKEIKAHKLILSAQSAHFRDIFLKPENLTQSPSFEFMQKTTNVVVKIDDDFEAVQSMISFMYGDRYKPRTNDHAAIAFSHVKTYALAEKYKVDGLKEFAKFNFNTLVFSFWHFDERFVRVIEKVYSSVLIERAFQETVAEADYENLKELRCYPGFQDAYDRIEKFQVDLEKYSASEPRVFRYICEYCKCLWVVERVMKDNHTDRCDCPEYRKSGRACDG
ncbi:hypothetical protein FQN50_001142 [Emmonsiellopsis sp. PD_5]|nr:hypothetical protein FQN50_001142 [Emmonsiellopsis sp. PD_5]